MTATTPLQVTANAVSPPEESLANDAAPTAPATSASVMIEESMRLAVTEDTFTPHDVVLGKGNGINSLPGNLRFRRIIWKYKPLYAGTPRSLKGTVAELVINEIACLDPPGRFLEPQSAHRCFRQVTRKRAIEKTCQALREKKNNMGQRQVSPDQERLQQGGASSSASPCTDAKKENVDTTLATPDKEATAEDTPMDTEVTADKTETSLTLGTNENKGPRKADPITTILENDVLYGGRGRRHFHRIANQRFLEMIKTSRAEYHESRCKKTVAKRIVHDWKSQDPPGRFLQQDGNTEKWFEIKPSKIMEKTCQALRDLKRERGPAGVKQGISERMIDPWEKSMPFPMAGQPMPMNNNGPMPPQPPMHAHGPQGHALFHPQHGPWMGGNPMLPQGGGMMPGGMMAPHPSMGQVPYQMPPQPMGQAAPEPAPEAAPMVQKKQDKQTESTDQSAKAPEATDEAEANDDEKAALAASDKMETNDTPAIDEEAKAIEETPADEPANVKEQAKASKTGSDKGDKTAEDKRKNGELEAAALLANMFR